MGLPGGAGCEKSTSRLDILPRRQLGLLSTLHAQFGGYIIVAVITYCLNEGFAFPAAGMALKVHFMEVLGLDGPSCTRYTLPARVGWIVKPFVGMLSDTLPVLGFRRASYFVFSCFAGLVAWTVLAFGKLPITAALPFLTLAGLSFAIPDVMVDAWAAELTQEVPEHANDLQTLNFSAFTVGGLIASATSGVLIDTLGPQAVFVVLAGIMLVQLSAVFSGLPPERRLPREQRRLDVSWLRKHADVAGLSTAVSLGAGLLVLAQALLQRPAVCAALAVLAAVAILVGLLRVLGRTSKAVARLAAFVFLHGCLQLHYHDTMFLWMRRARDGPHFSRVTLGWLNCFAGLGLLAGVFVYRRFLRRATYRCIFLLATIATALPSLLDLALVNRWNLALQVPDLVLAVGDETIHHCVMRLFQMPMAVFAMHVCPPGLEGSVMSLVLSLGGIGSSLSMLWGSYLLEVLGVVHGDFSRLPDAVALRGLSRLLPLLVLPVLIPAGITPSDVDVAPGEVLDAEANTNTHKEPSMDVPVSMPAKMKTTVTMSDEVSTMPSGGHGSNDSDLRSPISGPSPSMTATSSLDHEVLKTC